MVNNEFPQGNYDEYGIDNDPNNISALDHYGVIYNKIILNNIKEGDSIYLSISIDTDSIFEYVYDDVSGQRYTINDIILWNEDYNKKYEELRKQYGDDFNAMDDNLPIQYRIAGAFDDGCAFKFQSINDTINLHVKMKRK